MTENQKFENRISGLQKKLLARFMIISLSLYYDLGYFKMSKYGFCKPWKAGLVCFKDLNFIRYLNNQRLSISARLHWK